MHSIKVSEDPLARSPLACEQALFEERVKKSRGVGRERVRACSQTFGTVVPRHPLCIRSWSWKFKQMPAPDWTQIMLCIIVPYRRTVSPEFFLCSFCFDHGLSGSCTKEMPAVRKLSVWYKIPIWFQNTVCPKTKDAFPKIQACAYNRYSSLHRSCLA